MNAGYLWWMVVLVLVGVGSALFLALGRLPEADDEPAEVPAEPPPPGAGQSAPLSTTVPGADEPSSTSETP